jgi:hypothetical protein
MSNHHPVLKTMHPHRIGLHENPNRAQIQPPPPPPLTTTPVIPRTPTPAPPTPPPLPGHRPHRHHHNLLSLDEHHILDDRLLDPQNRTP